MELSIQVYAILWVAGFSAGLVDSVAGGGGIITIPVLLWAGLPPHIALGTNKLQASFGSLTASVRYIRSGLANITEAIEGIIFTAIGAAAGTAAIQMISADFLKLIMPILLVVIFFYMLLSPAPTHIDGKAKMRKFTFYLSFGLLIGFYDGFFGPGTGSFWTVCFIGLLGYNLKKATAHTKIMNFTSNIISLTAFIIGGKVFFTVGIIMGTGQVIGAFIGSHLVITRSVRFIKLFFLAVVAVTIAKLIYSTYFAAG